LKESKPENRFYKGKVTAEGEEGWARISLLGREANSLRFQGGFVLGEDFYVVKPSHDFKALNTHVRIFDLLLFGIETPFIFTIWVYLTFSPDNTRCLENDMMLAGFTMKMSRWLFIGFLMLRLGFFFLLFLKHRFFFLPYVHISLPCCPSIQVLDPEAEKCGVDDNHLHKVIDDGRLNPLSKFHLNEARALSGCPSEMQVLYMVLLSSIFSSN